MAVDFSAFSATPDPEEARRLADGFDTLGPLSVLTAIAAAVCSLGWAAWLFMQLATGPAWAALVVSVAAVVALVVWTRRRERFRAWLRAARFVMFARANGFEAHPPVAVTDATGLPESIAAMRHAGVHYRLSGTYRGRAFQAGLVNEQDQMAVFFLEVATERELSVTPDVAGTAKVARLGMRTTPRSVLGSSTSGRVFWEAEVWQQVFAVVDAVNDSLDRQIA